MNRRDLFKFLGIAPLVALFAGKQKEPEDDWWNDYGPKAGQIWHQRDFPCFTVYVAVLCDCKFVLLSDPSQAGGGGQVHIEKPLTQREMARWLRARKFTYEGRLSDLLDRERDLLFHGREENFAFNPRDDMEYWAEHKRIKGRPNTGNWKHQHEEEAEWASP